MYCQTRLTVCGRESWFDDEHTALSRNWGRWQDIPLFHLVMQTREPINSMVSNAQGERDVAQRCQVSCRQKLTWNPPDRLTSFLESGPESTSESSSAFTRFEVLGLLFFFGGAARLVLAPLVCRARIFSSACSLAANKASASTSVSIFCFFGAGGALVDSGASSLSVCRFAGEVEGKGEGAESTCVCPFVTVVSSGDWTSFLPAKISKRSIMSCLISGCSLSATNVHRN